MTANRIVNALKLKPGATHIIAMRAKYNYECARSEASISPQQRCRELARMESGYDHARLTGYER